MPYTHRFFSSVPKRLEQLLAAELEALGGRNIRQTVAGCFFDGTQETGYRVALWSRLANTVLLPIEHFDAPSPEAVYAGMREISWNQHFSVEQSFKITFHAVRAAITHNRYGAQVAKDAIVDQFRDHGGERPSVDLQHPDIHLNVHVLDDRATVSLDLAGTSLHRRGYRTRTVEAPLKENVAAAVLIRAGWPQMLQEATAQHPVSLVDPMCGSGTLLVEGALMAGDIAPGLRRRHFGFEGWRYHDPAAWTSLLDEAKRRAEAGIEASIRNVRHICGYDVDPHAIEAAQSNIERANMHARIRLEAADIRDVQKPDPQTDQGLVITNAPYGERLEQDDGAVGLHEAAGAALRDHFGGWKASVLTGSKELGFRLGMRANRLYPFYNGPIECLLLNFDIHADRS